MVEETRQPRNMHLAHAHKSLLRWLQACKCVEAMLAPNAGDAGADNEILARMRECWCFTLKRGRKLRLADKLKKGCL